MAPGVGDRSGSSAAHPQNSVRGRTGKAWPVTCARGFWGWFRNNASNFALSVSSGGALALPFRALDAGSPLPDLRAAPRAVAKPAEPGDST